MKVELYDLLPALYRNRDYHLGQPLRALLTVLADEVDELRQDIDRLYDNWFIETCDEWVVPYIGDLLAASGLHPGREGVFSLRAFVANTLAYRRRKGTASVLENIAQDVSGWSASVTEFFQLLTTTQHLSHVRPTTIWALDGADDQRIGTVGNVDVRKERLLASLDTPFDTASRTIDIRAFTQYYGWHNIDRLGVFIWRLRSYPMQNVSPRFDSQTPNAYQYKFHFHPLGWRAPLFTNPQRQSGATERRHEWEVPQPIDHDAFEADIERYYGGKKSLIIAIEADDQSSADRPILVSSVIAAEIEDFADWTDETTANDTVAKPRAYIDVERGRFVVETEEAIDWHRVQVSYHYGFSADISGGPYGREMIPNGDGVEIIRVAKGTEVDTLKKALKNRQTHCTVIRFMDSSIYQEETLPQINLIPGDELAIEAADGFRPTIIAPDGLYFIVDIDQSKLQPPPIVMIQLSGLFLAGQIWLEGDMKFQVAHCTLLAATQDTAAVTVVSPSFDYRTEINIDRSITGKLKLDRNIEQLRIRDSVIDGFIDWTQVDEYDGSEDSVYAIAGAVPDEDPACSVIFERSTVFGMVHAHTIPHAMDTIFTGRVVVEERQGGCMKYCYVESIFDNLDQSNLASRTPRRFRCQPDLALEGVISETERAHVRERVKPVFSSIEYGQPNYSRLSWSCPAEIRTGAANGSEIGVFGHLMEPQREGNLREAVRRYLPFGLDMNIIYADEETKS
ncbi:MAG: hypothetical protein MJE77_20305 [Proteobacteria bacterium]|nr:hypothetical protein [Pseudomonadota bacterium]